MCDSKAVREGEKNKFVMTVHMAEPPVASLYQDDDLVALAKVLVEFIRWITSFPEFNFFTGTFWYWIDRIPNVKSELDRKKRELSASS